MCIFAQIATVKKKKMLYQHHNPSLSDVFCYEGKSWRKGGTCKVIGRVTCEAVELNRQFLVFS